MKPTLELYADLDAALEKAGVARATKGEADIAAYHATEALTSLD